MRGARRLATNSVEETKMMPITTPTMTGVYVAA
jgi:hypothetical protein